MKTIDSVLPSNDCSSSGEQSLPGSSVMKTAFAFAAILATGLLLTACEEQETTPLDPGGNAPVLSGGVLLPDTINVDTLSPVNSLYTVTSVVTIRASDPDKDVRVVVARVLKRNSSGTLLETELKDDGVGVDQTAGDSVYSGTVSFDILRADAGRYAVEFLANDQGNRLSNLVGMTLLASRRNAAPVLDASSLIAPDTVTIPTSGFVSIGMSIAVSDSDGIADIRSVYFLSPDGGNPTFKFPMKDDGGLDPGPASGDLTAGDGVFTILLGVSDSPTIRGTYRFFFHAEDTPGDTSASVLHLLTIQ